MHTTALPKAREQRMMRSLSDTENSREARHNCPKNDRCEADD